MSDTQIEIRCGAPIGRARQCAKKVGSARINGVGVIYFTGGFQFPTDDDSVWRFHCPTHGDGQIDLDHRTFPPRGRPYTVFTFRDV